MNITLIPNKTNLIMTFTYKDKEYSLEVTTINKTINNLYITAILNYDKPLTHKELSNIKLTYLVENGFYVFEDMEIELVKMEDIYAYAIKSSYEAERINRRDSFRVFIGDRLNVIVKTENGEISEHYGTLKDLSVDGMGVILNKEIPNVEELQLYYSSDNLKVKLTGRCVRCNRIGNKNEYIYGCRFYGRSEVLSKFILSRQIKNKLSKDFYIK